MFFLELEIIEKQDKKSRRGIRGKMNSEQRERPRREWRRGRNWEVGVLKSSNGQLYSRSLYLGQARARATEGKGDLSLAGPFVKLKFKHFP